MKSIKVYYEDHCTIPTGRKMLLYHACNMVSWKQYKILQQNTYDCILKYCSLQLGRFLTWHSHCHCQVDSLKIKSTWSSDQLALPGAALQTGVPLFFYALRYSASYILNRHFIKVLNLVLMPYRCLWVFSNSFIIA